MSFNYSSKGVQMDNGFSPAPAGVYNCIIRSITEKTTKNGDPMVSAKCEIDQTGEWLGTVFFHNVTFIGNDEQGKPRKGAGMALNFLKHIGEPWEGDFEVSPDNWVRKTFRAMLKVEKDLKGTPRNQIAYLIDPSVVSDEVPF